MAKRPTLTEIGNILTSATSINDNNDAVGEAFDNTLSRDGSSPNQMEADIDLNGNDILNVGTIDVDDFSVRGGDIDGYLTSAEAARDAAQAAQGEAETSETNAATSETNAANSAAEAAVSAASVDAGNLLQRANDLSDVASVEASRGNLGLPSTLTGQSGKTVEVNLAGDGFDLVSKPLELIDSLIGSDNLSIGSTTSSPRSFVLDFANYESYVFKFQAVSGHDFRVSYDGGTTFLSGGSDYSTYLRTLGNSYSQTVVNAAQANMTVNGIDYGELIVEKPQGIINGPNLICYWKVYSSNNELVFGTTTIGGSGIDVAPTNIQFGDLATSGVWGYRKILQYGIK